MISLSLCFLSVSHCTTLDPPRAAPFPADASDDAGLDASSDPDSALTRCRINHGAVFVTDAGGVLFSGDTTDAKVTLIGNQRAEPRDDASVETVLYAHYIAGSKDAFREPHVYDLASPENADLATCAICTLATVGCVVNDAGNALRCGAEYRAVAGLARPAQVPMTAGDAWMSLSNVEFQRIVSRNGFQVVLDHEDCMYVDRLDQHVRVVAFPEACTSEDLYCSIAKTASQRSPGSPVNPADYGIAF